MKTKRLTELALLTTVALLLSVTFILPLFFFDFASEFVKFPSRTPFLNEPACRLVVAVFAESERKRSRSAHYSRKKGRR